MYNPPHPGEVFKELCMEPLDLSVTRAAKALGVTRKALSEFINGRSGLSTIMAIRIALATDTTPESWLNMQTAHDLWQAKNQTQRLKVKSLQVA